MYTRSVAFTDHEGNVKADLDAHESMQVLLDMEQTELIHAHTLIMLLSKT